MNTITLRHKHPGAAGDIILSHNAFTKLANSRLEVYIDYGRYDVLMKMFNYPFHYGIAHAPIDVKYKFEEGIHATTTHANTILQQVELITRTKFDRNYTILPPEIKAPKNKCKIAVSNKASTCPQGQQLPEVFWYEILKKLDSLKIEYIDLDTVPSLLGAMKTLSECKHYIGINSFFMHLSACYRIQSTIFWNRNFRFSPIEYGYIGINNNVYFDQTLKYLESKTFADTVESVNGKNDLLT